MQVFVLVVLTSLASVAKFDAISSYIFGRPTTTTRPTLRPREANFKFEGVDYEYMPKDLYEKNNDCYAHHFICIRSRTIINPVCGWDARTWYFEDYYSPCEIELRNCLRRVEEGIGMYGTNMTNDRYFYNGEGYACKYYVRMGGNMMDAYFGVPSARRKYDYETLRYHPYLIKQAIPSTGTTTK